LTACAISVLPLLAGALSAAEAQPSRAAAKDAQADAAPRYVVYRLEQFGADAEFGEWLSSTIPLVIAPGSWANGAAISYHAPRKLMVVCHVPAVHQQVQAFLHEVTRPARASSGASTTERAIVPTGYQSVPRGYPSASTAPVIPEPSTFAPVPASGRAPKHLFHFIIRYEGEGIVDDNVVKAMALGYSKQEKNESGTGPTTAYAPMAPQYTPPTLPTAEPPADAAPKAPVVAPKPLVQIPAGPAPKSP
jgi:hypothetical protein